MWAGGSTDEPTPCQLSIKIRCSAGNGQRTIGNGKCLFFLTSFELFSLFARGKVLDQTAQFILRTWLNACAYLGTADIFRWYWWWHSVILEAPKMDQIKYRAVHHEICDFLRGDGETASKMSKLQFECFLRVEWTLGGQQAERFDGAGGKQIKEQNGRKTLNSLGRIPKYQYRKFWQEALFLAILGFSFSFRHNYPWKLSVWRPKKSEEDPPRNNKQSC